MAAAGQGVSAPARSGPPAGAVGPALPFALAEGVRPLPRAGAGRMAEYLAGEVEGAVPSIVPGDTPDLASASGLEDASGPICVFVPSRELSESAIRQSGAGRAAGWLYVRYGTVLSERGEIPDDRLGHAIVPGPMRFTVVPLRVSTDTGAPSVQILGVDGAVLSTAPLTAAPAAGDLSLTPGISTAAQRTVTIHLPGFDAAIRVGATPEAGWMPRPLLGDLKVGQSAPDFELKTIRGDSTVHLSDTRGRVPTVLVFGSFT